MKKFLSILLITITLLLCSCSKTKDNYFYIGQSKYWLATYSITKANSLYYDSLTIQYLHDPNKKISEEKIGPIEFSLIGNSAELKSSYPRELQGVGNFHTGSISNPEVITFTFDKEIVLTITWKDKKEVIKLKRQN